MISNNNSAQQSPSTTSTTTTTAPSSLIKQAKEKKETKENVDITQQRQQKQANANTTASGTAVTSGAGGNAATPTNINQNSVNTILKKLGVNANVNSGASGASTGGSQSSPLSNLISSIGSGQSTHHQSVNNSVVNVNLNVLKDINIDEMIDDDDDEERKFLIKELEKKAIGKGVGLVNVGGGRMSAAVKQEMLQQQQNGSNYNSESENANVSNANTNVSALSNSLSGARKRSRSNSSTLQSLLNTSPTPASTISSIQKPSVVLAQQQEHLLSQLNITLNCHYCWAQFQLNVTKNFKSSSTTQPHLNPLHQQKENGKYMQHLSLHLNAPYKCNECSYPITDAKTFLKHKQFYKHDEKTCIMVDNDIQQTWV